MANPRLRLVPQADPTPDEAAADWLACHDIDPAALDDPAFAAWLAAAPAHGAAWSRAQALWTLAATTEPGDPMVEALRQAALEARPSPWPAATRGLLAACLVGAVGVAGATAWRHRAPPTSPAAPTVLASADPLQAFGRPDFTTAQGQRLSTRLPDGTQVELDTDTAIDLAFDGRSRHLRLLRGQAFFDVAHEAGRPFVVEAGGRTITDLGTRFTARLDGDDLRVALVQGRVTVQSGRQDAGRTLEPGQVLTLVGDKATLTRPADLDAPLAWRDGALELSNTRLEEAVAEMNRYGGRRLVIGDPRLKDLPCSGRFKVGDPERFVRSLSAVLPLRGRLRDDGTLEIVATGGPDTPSEAPRD